VRKKRDGLVVLCVVLGVVGGYGLYYFVLMELQSYFWSGDVVLSLLCLLLSVVGCGTLLWVICTREIKRWVLWLLCAAYVAALVLVLFARSYPVRVFLWNPLVGLLDLQDPQMLAQSVMNLLAFIPAGFFLRRCRPAVCMAGMVGVSLAIELVQYATCRGMFDTFDLLLYCAGMTIGVLIFRLWKIRVVK